MQSSLERHRQRREELGDEGGFTLIELLIVIVILGILAAIVVFAVQNLTGQSKTAACQAQYKTLETAQEAFKAQVGYYATAYDATAIAPATSTGGLMATTASAPITGGAAGPWIKDLPNTVQANGPYYYAIGVGANLGAIEVGTPTVAAAPGNGAC